MERQNGGVLLLQRQEPTKLLGSVMGLVSGGGAGLIKLVMFNEPDELAFEARDAGDLCLTIGRTVAFSLVAVLRVAAAQVTALGGTSELSKTTFDVLARRQGVKVVWSCGPETSWRAVNEQIELCFAVGAATELELALVSGLAQAPKSTSYEKSKP